DVWGVGTGIFAHWNGSRWDLETRNGRVPVHAVRDGFVVGAGGQIQTLEGGRFKRIAGNDASQRLNGIFVGPHDVWAVGEDDLMLRRTKEGWKPVPVPSTKKRFIAI